MKKNINICLFGRHFTQIDVIEFLNKLKFNKPIIILDKDSTYERDKKLLSPHNLYGNIEKLQKQGKVRIYKNKNVNSKSFLKFLKRKKINFGLSVSSRTIFKSDIIRYFRGNFFNLHDSMLPIERGGGLNSWRILLNRGKVGNTIHRIDKGIDTGEIIYQREIKLKKKYPKPIDFDYAQKQNSKIILMKFLKDLKKNKIKNSKKQLYNYNEREYFSRLYTKVNGALDVDLPPVEFERFVRAFSEPYPGAWIKISRKTIVFLKDIKIINKKKYYPKFANGRILRKDKNGVYVIIGQGLVKLEKCFLKNKKVEFKKLVKMNDILRNEIHDLNNAKNSIISIKKFK